MNFKHSKNLQESIDGMKKIFSISWSPNLMRLAVAHVDEKRNVRVSLFDENGGKQESFPTRPANKNNKSYVVREIAFSPDSTKLAVAQSDNIVFIYNLGLKWGDKKTICNKFEQNTQVTTMLWHNNKPNELYFGVAEGKIKAGILKNNYAQILYSTETYVVSLCASQCGKYILSGHIDQSIYKHSLESGTTSKIITFSSIPYCLSWTHSILIAGNDSKVSFYSEIGELQQFFDYSEDSNIKDFTVSKPNSSGELIAVGNYDKFFIFMYNNKKNSWEEGLIKNITNYFTITAMCWRPDMSSLVTGSLCGSIDIFESCVKKSIFGGKFEIIYMSHSQIMVKNLENMKKIVLKSNSSNGEIGKINFYFNQYIVLSTKETLIIGDINTQKSSEINWNFTGNEKFDFQNSNICMIHQNGEIAVMEFGINEILGFFRTEYIHPNLISARINYFKNPFNKRANATGFPSSVAYNLNQVNQYTANNYNNSNIPFNSPINTQTCFNNSNYIGSRINFNPTKTNFFHNNNINKTNENLGTLNPGCNKLIAFLIDSLTIHVYDLISQIITTKINHDCNIEFLDLNKTGTRLIFRDSKRCLYIYYLDENRREILLNFCAFVQWVPHTDILVAQDQKNIYVWYHIDDHENSKILPVKGEVEEVRRKDGKTEVIVEELGEIQIYLLNENLIKLVNAIDNCELPSAIEILETINFDNKSSAEIYWKNIAKNALDEFVSKKEKRFIFIAQRSYAAVGAFAKVKFLKDLVKNIKWNPEDENFTNSKEMILVQAKLLVFDKQFINAENLLLANNMERECLELFNSCKKFEDSLRIAELYSFPEVPEIKERYLNYLIDNKIYDKAGQIFEKNLDFNKAINLYLEGNYYTNVVNLILRENSNRNNSFMQNLDKNLVEYLCETLVNNCLYEKCGDFIIEIYKDEKRAIDLYLRGNCFEKALILTKQSDSNNNKLKAIKLIEENWGDYLFNQGLYNQAISHYQESEKFEKCLSCFINVKKWEKAIEYLPKIKDENLIKEFNLKIANYFKRERNLEKAEFYYEQADEIEMTLELYVDMGAWEKLERLIQKYDLRQSLIKYGNFLQKQNKFKDAEKVFIYAEEPDYAINMYKSAKYYDEMVILVKKYFPGHLNQTFILIGSLCEKDLNFKKAEECYISSNNPNRAVEMYFANEMIEEAVKLTFRIYNNNVDVIKNVVIEYKKNFGLNTDDINKILLKLNYYELAIRLECDRNNFDKALNIAENYSKENIPIVYYELAEQNKLSKNFSKAEENFLKAKRFLNAVKMYEEINDFNSAFSICRKYCENYLPNLYEKEGLFKLSQKEYENAEICFNKANKSELMYQAYVKLNMKDKAMNFAKAYCPEVLNNFNNSNNAFNNSSNPNNNSNLSNMNNYNSFDSDGNNSNINNSISYIQLNANSIQEALKNAEKLANQGRNKEAIYLYLELINNFDTDFSSDKKSKILDILNKIEKILIKPDLISDIPFQTEKFNIIESITQHYLNLNEFKKAGKILADSNQLSRALGSYVKGGFEKESQELINSSSGQMKQQLEIIYLKLKKENNNTSNDGSNSFNNYNNNSPSPNNSRVNNSNKNLQNLQNSEKKDENEFKKNITKLLEQKNYEEILFEFKERNKNTEFFTKIFLQISNEFFNKKKFFEFCVLLNKVDFNLSNNTIFILKNLSLEILAEENVDEVENLKILLDKRFKNFTDPTIVNSTEESTELIRLHKITNFQNIKLNLNNYISKFKDLFYNLSFCLLQYGDILNLDKILNDVIKIAKNKNDYGNAFIFSNKYMDLIESLENGSELEIDNQSLLTNIPWRNAFLSEKNILDEREMNEMKKWIAQISIRKDIEKSLNIWKCFKCEADNFEGNSICVNCNYRFDQCMISGLAIRENSNQNYKKCVGCHKKAIDKYWKDWFSMFKFCPWCKKSYK